MINKITLKMSRSKFYFAIKGYKKLLKFRKLSNLKKKHNDISHLKLSSLSFSPLFFSLNNDVLISNEIILRQYLIQFLNKDLHFAKLRQLGGEKYICATAPREWLDCFELKYSRVSRLVSFLFLFLFALNRNLKSFLILFQIILIFFKNIMNKKNDIDYRNTAYFFDLPPNCFPNSNSKKNEFNIINWYIKWPYKLSNLQTVSARKIPDKLKKQSIHNINFSEITDPLLFNGNMFDLLKLIFLFILDFIHSIISIIKGNLGNSILLPELLLFRSIQLKKTSKIAGHFLFYFNWKIYRPLWTYEAEKKGARVSLSDISLNALPRLLSNNNNMSYNYYPSTWPEHIVWSEFQKNEILKYSLNRNIVYSAKFIPFTLFNPRRPFIHPRSILVFDIEPQKLRYYIKGHGFSSHAEYFYYNKGLVKLFFKDIIDVAKRLNLKVYLKRKRILFEEQDYFYKNLIDNLTDNSNFFQLDPDISAVSIIDEGLAIIGTPFTSVPYIGKLRGIPSAYYDPINYILKNDNNNNGITLLSNKNDLLKWFEKIV